MGDEVVSIRKAAEYLGVTCLTLRNWEKRGKIKVFRTPGGHRRFKKSCLDKTMGFTSANGNGYTNGTKGDPQK